MGACEYMCKRERMRTCVGNKDGEGRWEDMGMREYCMRWGYRGDAWGEGVSRDRRKRKGGGGGHVGKRKCAHVCVFV